MSSNIFSNACASFGVVWFQDFCARHACGVLCCIIFVLVAHFSKLFVITRVVFNVFDVFACVLVLLCTFIEFFKLLLLVQAVFKIFYIFCCCFVNFVVFVALGCDFEVFYV